MVGGLCTLYFKTICIQSCSFVFGKLFFTFELLRVYIQFLTIVGLLVTDHRQLKLTGDVYLNGKCAPCRLGHGPLEFGSSYFCRNIIILGGEY